MYASGVDVECYNVWLYSRISWGQDNIHSYFDLIQFVQTISTKVCRILLCFFFVGGFCFHAYGNCVLEIKFVFSSSCSSSQS